MDRAAIAVPLDEAPVISLEGNLHLRTDLSSGSTTPLRSCTRSNPASSAHAAMLISTCTV
jgi:hypothetical protein